MLCNDAQAHTQAQRNTLHGKSAPTHQHRLFSKAVDALQHAWGHTGTVLLHEPDGTLLKGHGAFLPTCLANALKAALESHSRSTVVTEHRNMVLMLDPTWSSVSTRCQHQPGGPIVWERYAWATPVTLSLSQSKEHTHRRMHTLTNSSACDPIRRCCHSLTSRPL